MNHNPLANNCVYASNSQTGLAHCDACEDLPRSLKVEWGRVTNGGDTAFGPNIAPPDGTYIHLDTVREILARYSTDMSL